ncbi:MAG: GDSL-type esterase/lipase family protein [Coriobacteriia bacterium]|nr:GDSL-type esterase/lipase family protein [Coriobacteriia bacterium]
MKKLGKKARRALVSVIAVVVVAGVGLGIAGIWYYTMMHPAAPKLKSDVIKVACVGDSITYGFGVSGRKDNAYPAQLQALLGDDCQVLNYGLSRRSLLKETTKPNRPYTAEKFYGLSQEAQPDIVVIMLGSNDTRPENWDAAQYEKELEEFVLVYKGLASEPTVYLMLPPPFYEPKTTHSNTILEDELIPLILRVAARTNVETIDVHSGLVNRPELFNKDGLHPTADGARVIAETVYGAITRG